MEEDRTCKTDPECCPPEGSPFSSALDFRRKRLGQELTFAIFTVSATFGIWAVLLAVGLYALYLLIQTIRAYWKQRNAIEQIKMIDASDIDTTTSSTERKPNDDYNPLPHRPSTLASNTSYQEAFMKNLQKTSKNYQNMNKTLNTFFRKNYNKPPPDLMNESIILPEYDNW